MNTAIILAGGVGSRMGLDCPKQFLMVQDKPIISYCFDIFQQHAEIDKLVVVVSDQWKEFVEEQAAKYGISKICGYAPAGETRQHSIYNGLKCISVKDTVYQSKDGKTIDKLLTRSELFAGQAPESFKYKRYFEIHNEVTDEEIGATAGSSEIAYRHGMEIRMVQGSERNLKITTIEDLETFETILKGGV